MRRFFAIFLLIVGGVLLSAIPAFAGSPHFVDDQTQATVSGNTLTVNGKEAGLGDETQIHVVLTAEAQCINPGGNHPQAANKESFTAAGDFPVQNGKADFTLSVTAVFSPSCSPPMSVKFTSAVVEDTTNGLSLTLL
jgi:type II secretory pathway pseudopilin PulG